MPTTTDYTESQLSTLLTNVVTATELSKILNHYPNGAVVETDSGGPYNPVPQVADVSGLDPSMLILTYDANTIDTSQWNNLHQIIDESTGGAGNSLGDNLTIYSDAVGKNVTVYLDLNLTTADKYNLLVNNLNATTKVVGSDGNIELRYGAYPPGTTEHIVANSGHNNFIINNISTMDVSLKIGGGNNTLTLENENQVPLTVTGMSSTDIIHVVNALDTLADMSVIKTTDASGHKISEVTFAGTNDELIVNGWHQALTFGSNPDIHYI